MLYGKYVVGKTLDEVAHRSMLMCCLSVATYRVLNDEVEDTTVVSNPWSRCALTALTRGWQGLLLHDVRSLAAAASPLVCDCDSCVHSHGHGGHTWSIWSHRSITRTYAHPDPSFVLVGEGRHQDQPGGSHAGHPQASAQVQAVGAQVRKHGCLHPCAARRLCTSLHTSAWVYLQL